MSLIADGSESLLSYFRGMKRTWPCSPGETAAAGDIVMEPIRQHSQVKDGEEKMEEDVD